MSFDGGDGGSLLDSTKMLSYHKSYDEMTEDEKALHDEADQYLRNETALHNSTRGANNIISPDYGDAVYGDADLEEASDGDGTSFKFGRKQAKSTMNIINSVASVAYNVSSRLIKDDDDDMAIDCSNEYVVLAAIETKSKSMHSQNHGLVMKSHHAENLGDDFEGTPWVPPSLERAQRYKEHHIYGGSQLPLNKANLCLEPEVGIGVNMYFTFAKVMSITFAVMSIFALPTMIFAYNGEKIPLGSRDAVGFYKLTFGNIGYSTSSVTYEKDSACRNFPDYNGTCIHLDSWGVELKSKDVGYIILAMELLQGIIFLISSYTLMFLVKTIKQKNEKLECNMTDYTVLIRNLPSDTTREQLVAHFHNRYNLDVVDFRKRPPVKFARVVPPDPLDGGRFFSSTWVADVFLFPAIGEYIRRFKSNNHLIEKIFKYRAYMKMYSGSTVHSHGPNPNLYSHYERLLAKTEEKIEKLSVEIIGFQHMHPDIITTFEKEELTWEHVDFLSKNMHEGHIDEKLNNETSAAFVTFEYTESFARCIEDYKYYDSFPKNLFCFPEKLKFRGHSISISKAPDPEAIVWENLGVSKTTKFLQQCRTYVVVLVLMIGAFLVVLQTNNLKSTIKNALPSTLACSRVIPAVFTPADYATNLLGNVVPTRPETVGSQNLYDSYCQQKIPGSFYAIYTYGGDLLKPVANYSINTCASSATCPIPGASSFCPCVISSSTEICSSNTCETSPDGVSCLTFTLGSIGTCFCNHQLEAGLAKNIMAKLYDLAYIPKTDVCYSYDTAYRLSVILSFVCVFVTVGINVCLKKTLVFLTRYESHASVDHIQASSMLKVFFATYFNMAAISLMVFGYVENKSVVWKILKVFDGIYRDFDPEWYGTVGAYIMGTFCIQSLIKALPPLIMALVIKPLSRWKHRESIQKKTNHSVVMQHDLNILQTGPVFDPTINNAQLLALLFFGMTFSPGIPLMMPILSIVFFAFFSVDKYLFCRYYQRSPMIDDALPKLTIRLLPYALVIRMAFAGWMHSNPEILEYTYSSLSVGPTQIFRTQGVFSTTYNMNVADRLVHTNVLPLVVILGYVAVTSLLQLFWKQLPLYYILKIIHKIKKAMGNRNKVGAVVDEYGHITPWEIFKMNHKLRQEQSAFTGDYFSFLRAKVPELHERSAANIFGPVIRCLANALGADSNVVDVTVSEAAQGWGVEVDSEGQYFIKVKRFLVDDDLGKIKRCAGQQKKTWEVIHDHSCDSYDIEKIPAYSIVMKALHEGTNNLMKEKILEIHKNSSKEILEEICDKAKISNQSRKLLLTRISDREKSTVSYKEKLTGAKRAVNSILAARKLSRVAELARLQAEERPELKVQKTPSDGET